MKELLPVILPGLWIIPFTMVLLSLCIRFFPTWNLLDFPERYGLTRKRLPYPTGIVAVFAFLCAFFFIEPLSMQMVGVVLGLLMLATLTFIDDRTPLPFWFRAVMQILLCILLFITGSRIYSITNPADFLGFDVIKLDSLAVSVPFFGSLPILSGFFTIVWLGLTLNALNWFDGIPGQVSSLSTIGFIMMGILAYSDRVNQPHLAMLAFILAGISFACLLFDFPPQKMLLGDSGSMFFGLMLGLLGIYQGGKVATAFLVLGIRQDRCIDQQCRNTTCFSD
jgi:UDP-N-acetylmuramyl pentapeptide phosphotransferase/UDP-N-acetylglucosamine-1-phosphate transferase